MSVTIKLNKIFEGTSKPKENEYCIYCLFDNKGNCIYVGQTSNLETRIYSHLTKGKAFSEFSFEICKEDEANELEAKKIVAMNPSLNKTLPQNKSYVSTASLRDDLFNLIKERGSELPIVFSGLEGSGGFSRKYITSDDYNSIIKCVTDHFKLGEE